MPKHEHAICEHLHLSYCAICDVVFCLDCEREWVKPIEFSREPSVVPHFDTIPCGTGAPVKQPSYTITCNHTPCNCDESNA